MEKDNKLKKRYIIGSIVVILFLILMMCNILAYNQPENKNTVAYQLMLRRGIEKEKGQSKLVNDVLVHPTVEGIHAGSITIIGIGLSGMGYLLMIKEEWEKKKALNKEDWCEKNKEQIFIKQKNLFLAYEN